MKILTVKDGYTTQVFDARTDAYILADIVLSGADKNSLYTYSCVYRGIRMDIKFFHEKESCRFGVSAIEYTVFDKLSGTERVSGMVADYPGNYVLGYGKVLARLNLGLDIRFMHIYCECREAIIMAELENPSLYNEGYDYEKPAPINSDILETIEYNNINTTVVSTNSSNGENLSTPPILPFKLPKRIKASASFYEVAEAEFDVDPQELHNAAVEEFGKDYISDGYSEYDILKAYSEYKLRSLKNDNKADIITSYLADDGDDLSFKKMI